MAKRPEASIEGVQEMTISRSGGKIEISCDVCGVVRETGSDDWSDAWPMAKRDGWRAEKVCKDWLHSCPDCEL